MEVEMRRWLCVRVRQRDEERYVLTATLVIDEGFEPRPRRRHVHLHAQRLDDQLLGAWNGDRWRSRGSKGRNGHLVLAYCWKNDLLTLIPVSAVRAQNPAK